MSNFPLNSCANDRLFSATLPPSSSKFGGPGLTEALWAHTASTTGLAAL